TDDGNGNNYAVRSYFRYDLSEIPPGSTIMSATLSLKANLNSRYGTPGEPTSDYNAAWLRRVTASWSNDSLNWLSQPPADSASGSSLPQSDSTNENYTVDLTDVVRYWVNHPGDNYGMLFRLKDERDVSFGTMAFYSAQAPESLQPTLQICYYTGGSDSCKASFTDVFYNGSR